MISTIDILSIPIWNVTMEEARNLAFKCIDEGRAASIATANAEMVMRAQTDRELAHILQHADLVVPDGAGVLWAAEQQGKKFKERVTGVDLACSLLQEAAARQTPVYLFGGAPGIAEQAAAKSGPFISPGLIRDSFRPMKKRISSKISAARGRASSWSP